MLQVCTVVHVVLVAGFFFSSFSLLIVKKRNTLGLVLDHSLGPEKITTSTFRFVTRLKIREYNSSLLKSNSVPIYIGLGYI